MYGSKGLYRLALGLGDLGSCSSLNPTPRLGACGKGLRCSGPHPARAWILSVIHRVNVVNLQIKVAIALNLRAITQKPEPSALQRL